MATWLRTTMPDIPAAGELLTRPAQWQTLPHPWRWTRITILATFLLLWLRAVWLIYADTGLFYYLGTDFAMYWSQSAVLWSSPVSIYNLDALNQELQPLFNAYSYNHPHADAVHVPYPPLFAWLFTPFTLPAPPIGLALWEGLNLIAAVYLAWRASQLFYGLDRPSAALLVLISFPIGICLIVGQPQILLACAVAECYLSLRAGRDFAAGLWLACLLFKPQYGLLFGLLLIWKGRWKAVAGAAAGGFVVLGASIAVAGLAALMTYPNVFEEYVGFRADWWEYMINWRALVLAWSPGITDRRGMFYTQVLSALTILATIWAWRGPWAPRDARFPMQVTLLLLATLLTSHHSLSYGAAILAVPLASVLAEGMAGPWTRMAIVAGIILPALWFTVITVTDPAMSSRLTAYAQVLTLGGLLIDLWLRGRPVVDVR
ncbi:MAG TPA: glycosyltransferase family 87 protein [Nitrospiraceae bacterium]|nr:glycosyltransferase family 87 protein [Nitrospiraceae bacterium]